jgi:hypothetical protein
VSTPFLERFSYHVIRTLLSERLLEIEDGREEALIGAVAADLSKVKNGSLISSLASSLVASEHVVELWADNDQLKALVDDLDPTVVRG